MAKKKTQRIYWKEEQEQAVVRFLESNCEQERNKIYNEHLREPLNVMVELIIKRYKLYRKDFTFQDLHSDTMSFLATKAHRYDKSMNNRAYSYFGTICKNYLMGAIQKDVKDFNRTISYEDISSDIEEDPEHTYVIDSVPLEYRDLITILSAKIDEFMETEELTENEVKLGYALLDIFNNFDKIFQIGEGNKFNKNLILLSVREMTSLSTKDIRIAIKRFKKIYDGTLSGFLG